ncbi:benzoate 4-monooxygenase cytochrome P450 [Lasiosphaeria miniovina]|uniref:Benzoate 4-monooxygenase cytochrome P450 n=1 Tax=Lasiosphaeria miniovina TaxID=1954250 RepID=A0AA40AE81_9PEZI|nr:benzoate 4-monooxygenase cytochrome P450 [Lasiosphaeria miniovina]KAK0714043.1 benzoate 4-monooxygenase cytochrome P450 [Lasiosphaeria miniovina]
MSNVLSTSLTPSSLLSLVLVAIMSIVIRRRYFSPLSHIPGPFLASITRFWQVATLIRGDSIGVIHALHQKHGPFVRVAPNEVSVCHRDAPRKILLTALPKDSWYRAGALPDYRFQTTLSITDPKAKVARAKQFMQGFSTSTLLTFEHRIDKLFTQLLNWIDKFAADDNGKPMNLDQFFSFTAADITGELLFSKPFGFLEKGYDIDKTLARSHAIVGIGTATGYFPYLNKLVANPFVTWTGVLPFRLVFVTAMDAIAARRSRKTDTNDNDPDILTLWLQALADGKVTLRDVQAQTTLGIVAGTDAMSTGLQTFVYHTMRHPTAWRRCREEVVAHLEKSDRPPTRIVPFADAQEMPYLQACIKEALRLFGPLGTGLPRVALEGGTTIGDMTFPEGTTLAIHPYSMMRDKSFWGPDAEAFNPDRWLKDDSVELERFYMPFGLGYGGCPGINLAKIQMSKLAASLVRDYDVRQVNPGQEWSYEAYFNTLPHDWPVYVKRLHQ